MNNTRTLAIVAVLTAATLVVGLTVAATMTTSAFAGGGKGYGQDKYTRGGQDGYKKDGQDKYNQGTRDNGNDGGSGNQNGNTITALKCKNKGSASGFDTTVNQECENLICTHPGNNATCVSENEQAVTPVTPPVVTPPNIEECTAQDPQFDNDITMVDTVSNSVTLHSRDVICIQGLGNHAAFDLTTHTAIDSVLVSEGQCKGEHPQHEGEATLTSPPDAHLGNTRLGGTLCVGFATV
jgi:hypothetical protein